MKWIDLTLPTPEENLAFDEALLDRCESGQQDEVLRFWEPTLPFVVLGYSNRWRTETNSEACEKRGIPILRRCSGGGTILQGRGCLNYAVVLDISKHRGLDSITETNLTVLGRIASALSPLLGLPPEVRGHTDLTVGALKFSGNSQRRRKHFTLMHGTLLLGFDLGLIEECLTMPSLQPDYRESRPHKDFLMNLGVPAGQVKNALKTGWEAASELANPPLAETADLVTRSYGTPAWNKKF